MKRVQVYAYKVGLVFRKGNFIKVLTEGKHWVSWGDEVQIFNLNIPFTPPCELNILLENKELAEMLNVVSIKDNELGLVYREGNFNKVLAPGRYPIWKGAVNYEFKIFDLNELEIPKSIDKTVLSKTVLYPYIRIHVIESYEAGLLFLDGQLVKKLTAGTYYYWKNEKVVTVLKTDLRAQQMEISGQEILTKDKATLRINFFAQHQVVDIEKALIETNNFSKQLYILIQLVLREFVGTLTLDELLAKKETVQNYVLKSIGEKAAELGVKITDCGIRDIILPGEVKDIMNQVLVAEKRAQANIITRREETASTRSLLNTAKLMESNEMLFKLKEMEYVEKIAEKINTISVSGGGQIVEQLKTIFTRN